MHYLHEYIWILLDAVNLYNMTQELVPMKKPCRKCGQSFDTDDVTREQFILYGESVCRECYEEAGISAVSMDY